jgi:hypothetical protein
VPIVEGPAVTGDTGQPEPFSEGDRAIIEWPGDPDHGQSVRVNYEIVVELENGTVRHVPRVCLRKEN